MTINTKNFISQILKNKALLGSLVFVFLGVILFSQAYAAGPTYITGPITSDTTWTLADSPYVVQGDVSIYSDVTLTIQPGVVVKFYDYSSSLKVYGTLLAEGTTSELIYFTSFKDDEVAGDTNEDGSVTEPAAGDWNNLYFYSGSASSISHSVVRYGGYSGYSTLVVYDGTLDVSDSRITNNFHYGFYVRSGSLTISNCEIDHSGYFGLYQTAGTVQINQSNFHDNQYGVYSSWGTLTLTSNTFQNNYGAIRVWGAVDFIHSDNSAANNQINGIEVWGHFLSDRTWNPDLPYVIFSSQDEGDEESESSVVIGGGVTLTIQPGVVVKFATDISSLQVYGTLNAQGTTAEPIYFTSLKDDEVGGDTNGDGSATTPAPGDWDNLYFYSGSNSSISHSVVRYGGSKSRGAITVYDGTLDISASQITTNYYNNLNVRSGNLTVTNSEIAHSGYGLYQSAGIATISQSSFHDLAYWGVYNSAPTNTDARNNWWGDPTGPYHPTLNPEGLGVPVSDRVDFIPWLGYDPTVNQPPTFLNLNQYKSDAVTIIDEGQITTESTVVFKAIVSDPDNDQVKLEVELREFQEPFTGLYDSGILNSGLVDSGSEVVITRYGLVEGQYKWRARAIDSRGAVSDWQEFGEVGNVDFEVYYVVINVAVILAEPSDKSFDSLHNKAYFEGVIEQVKDYYCENSFGKWNEITKTCDGGVFNLGFDVYDNNGLNYKLPQTQKYYGEDCKTKPGKECRFSIDINNDGKVDWRSGDRTLVFVWDAINEADEDIFYNYDSIIVVYPGDYCEGDCLINQYWSPEFSLVEPFYSPSQSPDETVINWIAVSENRLVGSWAHELGHSLGNIIADYPLDDLYKENGYKYGGSEEKETKIGEWDLMAEGSLLGTIDTSKGYNPSHLSSFSKIKLGLLSSESIGYGIYNIESLETMKHDDKVKRYDISDNSYYLLEGRTRRPELTKWDTMLPIEDTDALVIYKAQRDYIGSKPFEILYKMRILDIVDTDLYYDPINMLGIYADGAIVDIPNRSLKINTEIGSRIEPEYIGMILRPQNIPLKQTWDFMVSFVEGLSILSEQKNSTTNEIVIHTNQTRYEATRVKGEYLGNKYDYLNLGYPDDEVILYVENNTQRPAWYTRWAGILEKKSENGQWETITTSLNLRPDAPITIEEDLYLDYLGPESETEYEIRLRGFVKEPGVYRIAIEYGFSEGGTTLDYDKLEKLKLIYSNEFSIIETKDEEFSIIETKDESGNEVITGTPRGPGEKQYLHIFGYKIKQIYEFPAVPYFSSIQKLLWYVLILLILVLFFLRLCIKKKILRKIILWIIISLAIIFIILRFFVSFAAASDLDNPVIPRSVSYNEIPPVWEPSSLDTDLHAYTPDGKHVGRNYETGEYENQIPGAITSRDLGYGDEWIFVPEGTNVYFVVSSQDVQETLETYPELQELTDGIETYEAQAIYYDEASQRYESNIVTEQIKPGTKLGHQVSGTYDIAIGPGALITRVDFDPDTLNLKTKGKWITVYIELPLGYDINEIDLESIRLNDQIPIEPKPTKIGDYDNNGIPDLMFKFNRSTVQDILEVGNEIEITITGEMIDGSPFQGSDIIRVISKGKGMAILAPVLLAYCMGVAGLFVYKRKSKPLSNIIKAIRRINNLKRKR